MSKPTNDRPLGILDIEVTDQMGDPLIFTPNRMAVAAMFGALPFMESEKMASHISGKPGVRLRTYRPPREGASGIGDGESLERQPRSRSQDLSTSPRNCTLE